MSDRVVWKYAIPHEGLAVALTNPTVRLVGPDPTGISYLPHIWIEHNGNMPNDNLMQQYVFIGTGHPVPQHQQRPASHVGSCICGELVWHVYTWQAYRPGETS